MAPRPGARAWLAAGAPPRKLSKYGSQRPLGREGGRGRRGSELLVLAGEPDRRPRGQARCISAPAALAPTSPGRGPRAASARPLGGACALVGAAQARAKATAEPGGGANPSPRIPGTGGQRRQPRILTLHDMPLSRAIMNIDLFRIS